MTASEGFRLNLFYALIKYHRCQIIILNKDTRAYNINRHIYKFTYCFIMVFNLRRNHHTTRTI